MMVRLGKEEKWITRKVEAKTMAEKISECYNIPENDVRIADTEEWAVARKAVDVAIFRVGIREVVEWTKKEGIGIFAPIGTGAIIRREINEAKMQSQLKKWGIK